MDKAKKSSKNTNQENFEMRITSMIEDVLKDSSSDEENVKLFYDENFDSYKKYKESQRNNFYICEDFMRLNISKKPDLIEKPEKFDLNCFEDQQRKFDFLFKNYIKDYDKEQFPSKAALNVN